MRINQHIQNELARYLKIQAHNPPSDFKIVKNIVEGILSEKEEYIQVIVKQQLENLKITTTDNEATTWLLGICVQNGIGVLKDEKRAAELYQLAAKQGHANAQCSLGACYDKGIGIAKDEKKALELFQLAANQGNAYAQFALGVRYDKGIGIAKDEKKALELFQLAANQGDADAQLALGVRYDKGIGIAKDKKKALELFQLAANHKKPDPKNDSDTKQKEEVARLFQFGENYYFGLNGFPKDLNKSIQHYVQADQLGNVAAKVRLANLYLAGEGVPMNSKYAAELYQIAASDTNDLQAVTEARCRLGYCFMVGQGVAKNEKHAVELFLLSAKHGNQIANYYLGNCYEKGIGVTKNIQKAFEHYKTAVKMGYAYAEQYLMALIAHHPELKNVKDSTVSTLTSSEASFINAEQLIRQGNKLRATDSKKSAVCYEQALAIKLKFYDTKKDELLSILQTLIIIYSELELPEQAQRHRELQQKINAELMYELGNQYYHDKSLRNPAKAAACYQSAVNNNHAGAQAALAHLYQIGEGVPKNNNIALRLSKLAADQENFDGQYRYGFSHEYGLGIDKNLATAVKYYKLAAEKGHAGACYKMGVFNENGIEVPKNTKLAMEYYKKSANIGNSLAIDAIDTLSKNHLELNQTESIATAADSTGIVDPRKDQNLGSSALKHRNFSYDLLSKIKKEQEEAEKQRIKHEANVENGPDCGIM